ncbi:baseplate J/gp47 family protein [Lonepinella sp. BR2474]|uniref:baseplate J/gp47 family protein n=1 Tax=Lonepinella sp. BR2474 TaxID=3434548 RepID=UPI003F6E1879
MFNVPSFEVIRTTILRDYQSLDSRADVSVDSDHYARASALAAVAEGVYAHQKWLVKQFFPDTADTAFLEKHAALRGIRRKSATLASGVGSATITGQAGAVIASGVQIKTADNRFYVVTEQATVNAQGVAKASVQALAVGSESNIFSAVKATFMSPPAGCQSELLLTNVVGGTDQETDASLLARLLEKIRRPAAGGNRYDYKNWALDVDGVDAAYVYPLRRGLGTVDIAITSDNNVPSDETVARVQAYIDTVRPVTAKESLVVKPNVTRVNFTIEVSLSGITLAEAQSSIYAALVAFFNGLNPGDSLVVSQCEAVVSDLVGVVDRRFITPKANLKADVVNKIEWFRLGNVQVRLMGA